MTRLASLSILVVLLLAVPVLAAIDYLGTEATWEWDQPAGDPQPDSWVVEVSRDGSDWSDELHVVTDQQITLTGERNQVISLRVAARLGEYRTDWSQESDPVTFRVLDPPGSIALKCSTPLVELPSQPGWWYCP